MRSCFDRAQHEWGLAHRVFSPLALSLSKPVLSPVEGGERQRFQYYARPSSLFLLPPRVFPHAVIGVFPRNF
jgi:hypothetical protein